jgi:hypothetical protein
MSRPERSGRSSLTPSASDKTHSTLGRNRCTLEGFERRMFVIWRKVRDAQFFVQHAQFCALLRSCPIQRFPGLQRHYRSLLIVPTFRPVLSLMPLSDSGNRNSFPTTPFAILASTLKLTYPRLSSSPDYSLNISKALFADPSCRFEFALCIFGRSLCRSAACKRIEEPFGFWKTSLVCRSGSSRLKNLQYIMYRSFDPIHVKNSSAELIAENSVFLLGTAPMFRPSASDSPRPPT